MDYFLELYGDLPRAGPGADELTRRALDLIPRLPESPRILDVGCGPGVQTIELLRKDGSTVVALDILPPMIGRLKELAEREGVSERLQAVVQDMKNMAFPEAGFDIVWSEGAIYNMGFEAGLRVFQGLVKPGGYVAVSDAVWLRPNPPPAVAAFWREYPEMDTVAAKLDMIRRVGFEVSGHFTFPANAWTDQYYDPLEKRMAEKTEDWRGIPEAEAVLAEAENEISLFRQYSDYYSYAFFVMRRPGIPA